MRTLIIFTLIFFYLSNSLYSEEWFTSAGNYNSSKYSKLDQINRENINQLKKAWIYKSGFTPNKKGHQNNQATPIFTGKNLIVNRLDKTLVALNPETGEERWRLQLDVKGPLARRGFTFDNGNLFVPSGNGIYIIDEQTGKINTNLGQNGKIHSKLSLVPPVIYKDKIYSIFLTFITAHEISTGKRLWKKNLNGARVWSGVSFEKSTNTLVFVTSNLINLIGNTNKKDDYSNSLVLLNAESGKTRCKFKDTMHDHWDLDMVGNPIIVKNNNLDKIYGFSKTGNIFVVDYKNCKLLNKDFIEKIRTESKSTIKDQTYSDYQIKVTNPVNLSEMKYDLGEYLKYIENDPKNFEYIKHKTRNFKFGDGYIPLSFDYDATLFNLHGGPEWPGASHDIKNNQIIVPTNHIPWVIRVYYNCCRNENEITDAKKFFVNLKEKRGHTIYNNNCKSCHGKNMNGLYVREFEGDEYIPSLNGITRLKKFSSLDNLDKFNNSHKYAKAANLTKKDLKHLRDYFISRDNYLFKDDLLNTSAVWQLILDKNGNYASIPPYGKITAFSTLTGKMNWQIPFGTTKLSKTKKVDGSVNFGGLLTTKGNIVIATGTTDNKIYVLNSNNGGVLWEHEMTYAGSSPPMTYIYKGNQYIIINSSGGQYYGYDNQVYGDMTYAFKLN